MLMRVVIKVTFFLVRSPRLAGFPIRAHFLNLLLIVEVRIVIFANATDALVQ